MLVKVAGDSLSLPSKTHKQPVPGYDKDNYICAEKWRKLFGQGFSIPTANFIPTDVPEKIHWKRMTKYL